VNCRFGTVFQNPPLCPAPDPCTNLHIPRPEGPSRLPPTKGITESFADPSSLPREQWLSNKEVETLQCQACLRSYSFYELRWNVVILSLFSSTIWSLKHQPRKFRMWKWSEIAVLLFPLHVLGAPMNGTRDCRCVSDSITVPTSLLWSFPLPQRQFKELGLG
jgi:hypothetical protein